MLSMLVVIAPGLLPSVYAGPGRLWVDEGNQSLFVSAKAEKKQEFQNQIHKVVTEIEQIERDQEPSMKDLNHAYFQEIKEKLQMVENSVRA
jgi:hypothetical protein